MIGLFLIMNVFNYGNALLVLVSNYFFNVECFLSIIIRISFSTDEFFSFVNIFNRLVLVITPY